MTIVELLISALAVWEIVEVWRHSALFATWRARVDLWEGKIGDLLRCPFCLSVWVSLPVVLVLGMGDELLQDGPRWILPCLRAVLYVLAVARLSNVFNDAMHSVCRTPKHDQLPVETEDEED